MPGNMYVFASRITLATAGVLVRISSASTRPAPSALGTSWWLMIRREDVEQSIKCARRVSSVQCRQNKMPGLGRGDGERNRFQVAHFANHNDIRIFPERSAQRGGERVGMREYFALRDVAVFRLDDVLNRVFEGDDVIAPLRIDLLNHRRQRCGFAGAHGTGRQNQSVLIAGE